ncbi:family 10 glycosylhydrolase [Desulfobacterales bacterium HSG17]|nr:family 10 glycosylhydrolase [Desulfobacterales bacterium HSG17]
MWISYIDWPGTQKDPNLQKKSLVKMLDEFKRLNFNAVIFHTRVESDAVYKSDIEPWSRQLTGIQGRDPGYDPLDFIVKEAHKRGMELHAWINPYRVNISKKCSGGFPNANKHISKTRPEWILNIKMSDNNGCYKMLNPGIPEITDYISDITQDIVKKYNIDGIHFDDMFYPYPFKDFKGITWEDKETFIKYKKGNISIKDWRRRNVNQLIRQVNAGIKKIKKHVRFGVSPFGIWQNEIPKGIKGMSAYDVIYSDAMTWLEDNSIDYLAPQLYWKIGGRPDYEKLLSWWGQKVKQAQKHIYPGQIIYYIKPEGKKGRKTNLIAKPETSKDILDQVNLNRENRDINVLGNTFYRAVNIQKHILGSDQFKNKLIKGLYATPALPWVV